MSDMPMPKKGKIWDSKRDACFPYRYDDPGVLEMELRTLSRETGAPRIAELEARRRAAERDPMIATQSPQPIPKPRSRVEDPDVPSPAPLPVSTKKQPKPAKAKRAAVPDGYVTISELATTWDVAATDCRAALRASNLVKPDYGWAFGPKEIPKIKKLCGVK